jgi:hypothetical protein
MTPPRVIKASEVREYVFCPRSWAYRQRKIASTPEAAAEREERLDQGTGPIGSTARRSAGSAGSWDMELVSHGSAWRW